METMSISRFRSPRRTIHRSAVSALTAIRNARAVRKSSAVSREGHAPLPLFSLGMLALTGLVLVACSDGGSGPPDTTLDLSVSAAYIVQSTQHRDGTVPLVAGRPGVLRVFVVANAANTTAPPVTVQIYSGATLRETLTAPASNAAVPTAVNQGRARNAWDFDVAATLVQPGLRFLVTVDPQNAVDEANDANNTFPAGGTPQAVNVSVMPPLRLRFVPIHDTSNQLTGAINSSNLESYLEITRKIMPVVDIDADIRAPYSVRGEGFDPQGITWQNTVSELNAVRVAEGTNRYYYGVVNTPYAGGGVVGIASAIGGKTSLGWDRSPDHDETLAHELGHNWGRRHAPCGGAGGVDPNWPSGYTLGMIGVFGFDVATGEVKLPQENTDIMGYCQARFWISDYTYQGVFTWRLANDQQTAEAPVSTLLVWGRITEGELVLEPSFEVVTRPVLPQAPGPYTLDGVDAAGARLFSISFAGEPLADIPGDHRQFAFAIPVDGATLERLAALRLRGRGREVRHSAHSQLAAAQLAPGPRAPLARQAGPTVSVEWDAAAHPAVMVRDAQTGTILSIARGGRASVANTVSDLELLMSDGVRTTRTRIRP